MENFRSLLVALIFSVLGTSSCSSVAVNRAETPQTIQARLGGWKGCFLLFDMKQNKLIESYNKAQCADRRPACSTFKLPLAVMAFDAGVLKNKDSTLKWDGEERMIPAWNQDHTAESWMRDSVVWFSQKLTPKLGRARIQNYLERFNYGNHDFTGGLQDAWLTTAPFLHRAPKTSVFISGDEQLEFLKALWSDKLAASKTSMALTRNIIPAEPIAAGFTLKGKTGSGIFNDQTKRRIGWFVAHIQGHDEEYLSVVQIEDRQVGDPQRPFIGNDAKQIMRLILNDWNQSK